MNATKIVLDPDADAIVHVDVQPTFMPGGGLAVKDGHLVVPVCVALNRRFELRFATLDSHPYGHISLASSYRGLAPYTYLTAEQALKWSKAAPRRRDKERAFLSEHARFTLDDLVGYLRQVGGQVLWPDHGIEGSDEAQMHPDLYGDASMLYTEVKGWDPKCDSYSGFRDNLRRPTGFADVLREHGVRRVFLTGLAFDFCVGWTALDGREDGFEVVVIGDATRSVDMPGQDGGPGTVEKMRADLAAKKIPIIDSSDILGG